ncbi:Ribosomal RNA-processing protein 7-like protein A [Heterocephalus glaber]|uniref:Ribosomal RNA-processing protein 7-like protein A n=1 Tax=Heterocephalus glaber TaxID=10181 RepID=G5BPS1_HETGA|nr:Ribosomal RNA-processing protein 7-like protein A [Heterocephalus glaber]
MRRRRSRNAYASRAGLHLPAAPALRDSKMVARGRRKRAVQDTEGRLPSPLGYSAVPIKFSEKQQASHYLYVREHRVREGAQSTGVVRMVQDKDPVPAVPIKFSEKQQASHYLYVREHRVREGAQSTWPQKRTLFVLNVPPYCSEESLSRLLSPCGLVQSVELQEKPDLVESPKEPKSKFFHPKPVPGPLLVSTESHPVRSGIHSQYRWRCPVPPSWAWLGKGSFLGTHLLSAVSCPWVLVGREWISDYADAVADPEALRVEVDAFMEAYDKKVAEEETKAKGEEGVPDEEGWVKVTRRGRRPVLPRTEAASLRVLERERQKGARKELLNFYAWQHRETKMEHLAQLRKKFEEDKQRIELLRAQRKFRPY